MNSKIPKFSDLTDKEKKDLLAVLYALMVIRDATGHGKLVIAVKDGEISEMRAEHDIRPKFLNIVT